MKETKLYYIKRVNFTADRLTKKRSTILKKRGKDCRRFDYDDDEMKVISIQISYKKITDSCCHV